MCVIIFLVILISVVIDPQKTGLIDYKESLMAKNSSQGNYDGWPEGEFQLAKNVNKENDISVACQTEDKSPKSNFEKFYEERRSLESRLAADKETQIKWIEKEIYHLNVLRE